MKKFTPSKNLLLIFLFSVINIAAAFAVCPTITIAPASLSNGTAASAYSQVLSQTGGSGTVTYSFTGALPAGLTLSAAGTLSGTPTVKGTFNFTVTATDAGGCTGTQTYTLIIDCGTLVYHPTTMPSAVVGVYYSQAITITGGVAPITYTLTSGSLPPGLIFNAAAGLVYGTPTTTGTYSFTINAVDANGCVGSAGPGYAYSITVACSSAGVAINVSPSATQCYNTGTSFGFSASPSGGVFSVDGTAGSSVYMPAGPGSHTVTYTVTDVNGCVRTGSTYINAAATPTMVTAIANPSTAICPGQTVQVNVSGAGSGATYIWNHPATYAGPTSFIFSPTVSDTYSANITTFEGCHASVYVNLSVQPPPTFTVTSAPMTGNKVCTGGFIKLNATTSTYLATLSWSGGITNDSYFTPSATTTYTVTGTTPSGCSGSQAVTVTVNPLPVVTGTSSADSICPGSFITLTGHGADTYAWNLGVTNGVPVSSFGNTYTVTGTSATTGCSGTGTVTVVLKPAPSVTPNSSASTVCAGAPVTLNVSGTAGSYSWSHGVVSGVPFNPTATTTYTVTGTSTNGCSRASTITVTVTPAPNVTATSNAPSNTVCAGSPVIVSGGNASTYSWSGSVTNGAAFVPTATTTYTVTGTSAAGCSNTAAVTVTVNPIPVVGASSNASANTICAGQSIALSGSGASSYSWNNGVVNGVAFTPASGGTYSVTGTSNGCSSSATIAVTVNPIPAVTASTTANAICEGASVTLSGNGADTYSWNNGVTDGVSFTPSATATYTVTGTTTAGCSNTSTIAIIVNPIPVVTVNATANAICEGASVTLSGNGADTYTWNNGVADGVSFTPSATATYTVTGTTTAGCSNTSTIVIIVNPIPVVTASTTANAICEGASVILSGNGATTYSWNNGVTGGVSFTPAATATYTVTGTTAQGCSNTSTIAIIVNPIPVVTASPTATAICEGASVTLSGNGADTYSWNNGVTNGVSFTPSATATYMVTGTTTAGCSNTSTVTIIVNPIPAVTASATANSICEGASVTLSGNGADNYTWNNGITDGISFTPAATATYTVTGTTAAGCSNTSTVTIIVNPLPVVDLAAPATFYCEYAGIIALPAATPAGGTYSGTGVSGTTFNTTTGAGTYPVSYSYTDANGCTNTDTEILVVDICTGIATVTAADAGLTVYPNPGTGIFTLVYNQTAGGNLTIRITDLQGKVVAAETLVNFAGTYSNVFDLGAFDKGVYLVEVTGSQKQAHQKVIIQ